MLEPIIRTLRIEWLQHGGAWVVFAVYLAAAWVLSALTRWILKTVVGRLARRMPDLAESIARAATVPVRLVIFATALKLGLDSLQSNIPSFQTAPEFGWIQKAMTAILILAVTHMLNALLKAGVDWYVHNLAASTASTWDDELLPLIRRVLSLVLYFIAISIILETFGKSITALVTTAGIASLAVALAAQETLSNMLGGFVILVDRPFKVGDVIELADGKMGEVVEIGLRSTRIQLFDGNALVVPNKDMASTRITNLALPTPKAAIRQTIGVDYGTDIEKAKRVLLSVLEAHPEVLKDPEPGVWFTKFSASSLDLFMSCWVASYKDRFRVTDELNVQILKAFREAGITIPFPQQDVHLYVKEKQG